MSSFALIGIVVFIMGYLLIVLEHRLHTNKSGVALLVGAVLWIIVSISGYSRELMSHELEIIGSEIFSIFAFLLAAMTLVEILIHYRLFDFIRYEILQKKYNDRKQFVILGILTFFLSAVLDNLTITIVMTQIARQFFKGKNLLIAVAGIVIFANSGGAWSPIGDVTTIMIWLAGKFTTQEIVTQGLLPSIGLALVSGSMLYPKLKDTAQDAAEMSKILLTRGEKLIIGTTLASFSLPLLMNVLGLQPYIGLLLGLGIVWIMIEYIKTQSRKETHLTANIDDLLKKTDISSLKFFAGILLAVAALKSLGVLELFSDVLFGEHQVVSRIIPANIFLGLLSAILDNVPLTALALDIIKVQDPHMWVLLALTVGTGGSFLVIGSVAGVIAMGMVKELTFGRYMKIASVPALVGYFAAVGIWYLQYLLIG